MKSSSNGNIFRVTVPMRGEFTGHRWIPLIKASHAAFFYLRLSKQSTRRWFETPLHSFLRHCNAEICMETLHGVYQFLWIHTMAYIRYRIRTRLFTHPRKIARSHRFMTSSAERIAHAWRSFSRVSVMSTVYQIRNEIMYVLSQLQETNTKTLLLAYKRSTTLVHTCLEF